MLTERQILRRISGLRLEQGWTSSEQIMNDLQARIDALVEQFYQRALLAHQVTHRTPKVGA